MVCDPLHIITMQYKTYLSNTGIKPTRIYVGEETWEMIKRHCYIYQETFTPTGATTQNELLGMKVFIVTEEKHLFIC